MNDLARPTELGRHAMPMAAPSPLVGEGSTAIRYKLNWVRGLATIRMLQPLTRLRFAKPPSPTRGEGKKTLPHPDGFAIQ
jgi:hypothetical protein